LYVYCAQIAAFLLQLAQAMLKFSQVSTQIWIPICIRWYET